MILILSVVMMITAYTLFITLCVLLTLRHEFGKVIWHMFFTAMQSRLLVAVMAWILLLSIKFGHVQI